MFFSIGGVKWHLQNSLIFAVLLLSSRVPQLLPTNIITKRQFTPHTLLWYLHQNLDHHIFYLQLYNFKHRIIFRRVYHDFHIGKRDLKAEHFIQSNLNILVRQYGNTAIIIISITITESFEVGSRILVVWLHVQK